MVVEPAPQVNYGAVAGRSGSLGRLVDHHEFFVQAHSYQSFGSDGAVAVPYTEVVEVVQAGARNGRAF